MINIPKRLAQNPPLCNLGLITNPDAFSADCSDALENGHLDESIMFRNGKPNLEHIPIQFHPAILKAVDAYTETTGRAPEYGAIHISQLDLKPFAVPRVGDIHVDAIISAYPETDYGESLNFIVSDCFPTRLFNQPFDLPENLPDDVHADEIYSFLRQSFEDQINEDAIVTPDAYEMMQYDPYVVHQAQVNDQEVRRTMMLVRLG